MVVFVGSSCFWICVKTIIVDFVEFTAGNIL
ncbi:hypothetical protein NC652_004407 [Populus alba x Populus x berolinensis]|uniref:Uncharacterized protein n=1 Tax=Populus alba x Populus x berolinensis TaxID=444605 RepID=A0AAD6RTV9_9ROSI|nr:hypothetical protein NC652_004407 [Populus alba x Populus x berolinensis]KAJ7015060.1 hypothetical protein NC653_004375 [Populus alba x Populus x berolinensis]